MKNKISLLLVFLMFLAFPLTSEAATMKYDDVPNGSYIIGKHIFTIEEMGTLTVKEIMYAAQTIGSDDIDDMKIIYKTMSGKYVDEATDDAEAIEIDEDDTFDYLWFDMIPNLSSTIEEQSLEFNKRYYDKFSSKEINTTSEEFDSDLFYVGLGSYEGTTNPTELKINGTTYNKENKTLSIGKGSKIVAPVWKIEGGELYVGITWLVAEALPGANNVIEVGGTTTTLTIFDETHEENELTIKNVFAVNKVNGHTNDVQYDGEKIMVKSSHGHHIMAIILQHDGSEVLDSSDIVYRLASDGSMGLTVPETYNSKEFTYGSYMNYYNGAYEEALQWQVTYKLAIPGKGAVTVDIDYEQIAVLEDVIEEKSVQLRETYYNKYNSKTIEPDSEEFDADIFYVKVGKYNGTANPVELKINAAVYNNQAKPLSIGNNGKILVPVWKIENGDLYVAITWLIAETLPGTDTVIEVGGVKYTVCAFNEEIDEESLVIGSAFDLFTVSGYTNNVTLDEDTVTQTSSHGRHAFGIILEFNDTELLDNNIAIYRLSSDQSMGLTTPETLGGKQMSYGVYMNYFNGAYTEEKETNVSYKLAIPGKGVTTFNIEYNQIVEE